MKHIVLNTLASITVFTVTVQAEIAATKTFSSPGIIKVEYPGNFVVLPAAANQAVINYTKNFVDKAKITPNISFDQMAVILTAYTQEGGEYAHLNIALTPPELTQEDLSASDADMIQQLKEAMELQIREGFSKNRIELVGDFTGKKEELFGGIKCFTLSFSYKKSDGTIRIDTKRYIYTKRHTIMVGITTSPGYAKTHSNELEKMISSIAVSNY